LNFTFGEIVATERKVVVKGGGRNLYKISEYGGWFHIYAVEVKLVFNDEQSIGKVSSLPDALDLIRAHSGREIEDVGKAH
jgi:hypothetical protein